MPKTNHEAREEVEGQTMHAVKVTVDPEDLAKMRGWLDERRFEPLLFWYDTGGEKIIVGIQFELANEAAAFCSAFGGQMVDGDDAPTPAPPLGRPAEALSTSPS
jgi:hypothetical protein